jgi:hypothetical protein
MYFTSSEAGELPTLPSTSKFASLGRKMGSKSRPPPLSLTSQDVSHTAIGLPQLTNP